MLTDQNTGSLRHEKSDTAAPAADQAIRADARAAGVGEPRPYTRRFPQVYRPDLTGCPVASCGSVIVILSFGSDATRSGRS